MRVVKARIVVPLVCVVVCSLMSGCNDYKRRYDNLNVEHQNLAGRYELLQSNNDALSNRIAQDQQTIDQLRKQIEELNQTPADATGFGEGYDVAFDAAAGTITVTLPNTILFDSGKAELKSATNTELDHILSVLKSQYVGKQVEVVGHTDTDPISKTKDLWKDNWELSAERALSVTRYLIAHGVPGSQIKAAGCGPDRPIAPNNTAAGKAKNRRVEIVVFMRG